MTKILPEDRNARVLHAAPEPPAYLAGKILRSIEREERKKVRREMMLSVAFLLLSLASAAASMVALGGELARSDFFSFASLFGSDFSFAVANFHEIFLSLVESFPAISGAVFLASVGFAVWFGVRLIAEAGTARKNHFAAAS